MDSGSPGYIVKYRVGSYHRRGQYGRDEMTDTREGATVFVSYEAAREVAERIGGFVVRHTQQLSLL